MRRNFHNSMTCIFDAALVTCLRACLTSLWLLWLVYFWNILMRYFRQISFRYFDWSIIFRISRDRGLSHISNHLLFLRTGALCAIRIHSTCESFTLLLLNIQLHSLLFKLLHGLVHLSLRLSCCSINIFVLWHWFLWNILLSFTLQLKKFNLFLLKS